MDRERVSELTSRVSIHRPGHQFLKAAWCIAGNPRDGLGAVAAAKRFVYSAPNLDVAVKTAIAAGDTGTSGWASQLSDFFTLSREWISLVSKKTVLGQLDAMRVAFQTRTIISADSAVAGFVAEGAGIPVQALNISDTETLGRTKLGIITAVTDDLLETWSPGTEAQLQRVLETAVIRGGDAALLNPDSAAVAGARPASLLNGISPLGTLGGTVSAVLAQVKNLLQVLVNGGSDLTRAAFVMHPTEALTLSTLITTEGVPAFPQLGAKGGFILGVPALTSVSCVRSGSPSERVFGVIDGGQVAMSDDGEVTVAASKLATLQMDSAPTQDSTGTPQPTNTVSLFQTNTTAVKLVRAINWQRASNSAAAWLTVAA